MHVFLFITEEKTKEEIKRIETQRKHKVGNKERKKIFSYVSM